MRLKNSDEIRANGISYTQLSILKLIQSKGLVLVSEMKQKKEIEQLLNMNYIQTGIVDHKGRDVKVLEVTNTGKEAIKGFKDA